jgi:hypothetical protein
MEKMIVKLINDHKDENDVVNLDNIFNALSKANKTEIE